MIKFDLSKMIKVRGNGRYVPPPIKEAPEVPVKEPEVPVKEPE